MKKIDVANILVLVRLLVHQKTMFWNQHSLIKLIHSYLKQSMCAQSNIRKYKLSDEQKHIS